MKVVSVIWAIVRGLLRALAKDYVGSRQKAGRKAKERPWWAEDPAAPKKEGAADGPAPAKEAAPKEAAAPAARATAPSWWGKPAPPPTPPTIKVETDEGTFIAVATFSGEHMMGIRRVERPRQEGERRRRRRGGKIEGSPVVQAEVEACACEPEVPEEPKAEASTQLARRDDAAGGVEVAVKTGAQPEGRAVPIEPGEKPRVERATRVRCRLGPAGEPGAPWVATTLATRLALTRATGALARKGGEG